MRVLSRLALPALGALLFCQGCANTAGPDAPGAGTLRPGTSGTAVSAAGAARANLDLGAAYLRQGQLTLALERLDRALEHDPRLAEAHSTIAIVYDRLGEVEEAGNHHRRAIRLEPDNPATANGYGVFLCRQARWSEAEPHFLRAAGSPRYHTPEVALTNAGICARKAGDRGKAERYLRDALARNPAYPDGLFNMAALAYENGRFAAAQHLLHRHFEDAPDTPQAAWLCVRVETRLGNRVGSQHCASRLRENFPESAEAAQLDLLNDDGAP